ncbi:MAG: inositol-3-phosphate synthase [Ignavibacteria bacterium]|nr:inositol-3-phosphate synthase [Ignavibacteria bacterium]MCU7502181.1 inositol-3-phosphate synthase [Ignavibacteria bacterium]MCU7517398.1 inositol-3-phosphate synthase [Ignavibacteria bacterium]
MIVGINGAVATTFLAGVMSIRKGFAKPFGSLTQMGTIRLGHRKEEKFPMIKDFVPLAGLDDLVFGGWDIRDENCYESALNAKVLEERDLIKIRGDLEAIRSMPGVFERKFVKRLNGTWIKKGTSKFDLMEQLRDDIRTFKEAHGVERMVVIWCGSTEIFLPANGVHKKLELFEEGMKNNSPNIPPSMLYAYAAISEGVPFINGAPNLTVDTPAIMELAEKKHVPVAGKDFKTGQTLIKTVIAPMLKARMLGLNGWFSSNILGNRDGEVLDDPGSFKTKEESKLSVLEGILQPELYPELYGNFYHKVRINYYPPRGDNKEGWDNIDIFGWMGYQMQLKIDFLCRDSILAAPIVLDLILFADLAQRSRMYGVQDWLSFYFKSPMHTPETVAEHDLFIQMMRLKNKLRQIMGEELITHLEDEMPSGRITHRKLRKAVK